MRGDSAVLRQGAAGRRHCASGGAPVAGAQAPLRSPVVGWFLVALAVRVLAVLAVHWYSGQVGNEGFYPLAPVADDAYYWDTAVELYEGGAAEHAVNVYPHLLAALFWLTGPSLLAGQLLNAVVGAAGVYFLLRLVALLTDETAPGGPGSAWPVHAAGLLVTIYPNLLFWSTQLVKDPFLILFGVLALYGSVRFLRRPAPVGAALWAGAFLGLCFFRPYAALAHVVAVAAVVLASRPLWVFPLVGVLGVAPRLAGWGWFGADFIQTWVELERLEAFREEGYSHGGTALGLDLSFGDPLTLLPNAAYSTLTAMFGPFPWQLPLTLPNLVALLEACALLPLVPGLLRGVWGLAGPGAAWRRPETSLLIFYLVHLTLIGLLSDNIGADMRLRLLPCLALICYCLTRRGRGSPAGGRGEGAAA